MNTTHTTGLVSNLYPQQPDPLRKAVAEMLVAGGMLLAVHESPDGDGITQRFSAALDALKEAMA